MTADLSAVRDLTSPGARRRRRSGIDPDEARLRRLLARTAAGDLEAFQQFYDATCDLAWRLELCRHRDPVRASESVRERYRSVWQHASAQPASGLSPRAWLLAQSVDRIEGAA